MILNILQYPDQRLGRIATPVTHFDARIQTVIDNMFETHYATSDCAALAATQLDLDPPWRITVIDFSEEKNQPLCLVNPVIIDRQGEQYEIEGCMSVYPEAIYEKVKRAYSIVVKAQDRDGKPFEMQAEGFMAKCIQHEIDHLDGKIFLNRLNTVKLERVQRRIKKHLRVLKNENNKGAGT